MRRKIEITTDDELSIDGTPLPAADAEEPIFGDHVNPPTEHYSQHAETRGAEQSDTQRLDPADGASAYITALQAEIEELRNKLETSSARLEEAEKRTLYAQAEFQNYRRRRDEERGSDLRYANSELVKGFLPVVDNFERALAAAEQTKNVDTLVAGISGTLKHLQAFLQKHGVTPIEALGKEFDPNLHEAIGHAETSELPPNTVAEEVQRGYRMHDKVLRPTLVKVTES